ncbi:MAG: phage tail tape measure protein [Bacteroidaceae bacterium]|nr:phage tail tape measure protein [Bacteroidaceae bacterium]MBQ8543490.1 phage tail tape measure protein [Bacteroidaceae bacterium]
MATIRDVAEVLIKIDDKEAQSKLPALEKKADDLKRKFEECTLNDDQKGLKEAEKGLRKVYREMDNLQKRTMDVDSAMAHLSTATPKELKRVLEQINRELNSGAIKRGTKEWDEYNDKLKQVKAELKKIANEQKEVTDSGLSFKDMLDIGGNLSMIFGSFIDMKDTVADFVRDNVNSYIELDAEMANVQKFTGMTREGVEELNAEFKNIDTRTSVIELNKLAEEAGRLGKTSKEDVLGFVKAADIINVALDDLGEGATLEISKLTNIFGDEKALGTEKSMLAVGSVINELSQNCTAAAPYLANFTKRLAGVGSQAEMTIPQIMGYAAVLDSQGQAVEMSATAVSQLITKMFQDPTKIAKAVGMDIQEFTNLVKTDTNAALLTLLERLNSMGNMDVLSPIFKEMGTDGARASAVLASLTGNIDMVKQQQEVATQAYNEATSVVKEFTVQNETEEAKLEKKRKKLEEVKVALGEKLLPIMGGFTSTGTMMIKTLNALLDVFNDYKATIISTGSAVLVYTGYIKIKNLWTEKEMTLEKAKLFLQEKSRAMLKKLKVAMMNNPWGIVIVAITAVIGLLVDYNRRLNRVSAGERALGKIREEANKKAAEEEARLKALVKTAEDENASLESRKKAIDALNQIIPGYNAQLDETTGQYTANADALTRYNNALKKKYELEGAKDMLAEMGGEKARLNIEKAEIEAEIERLKEQQRNIESASTSTQAYGTAGMTMGQYSGASIAPLLASKKVELEDINQELDDIAKKEAVIFGAYGEDLSNSFADDVKTNNKGGGGSGGGDIPKTEDKLKEEIKQAERAAKEKWVLQRAIEDAAYSRGEISYQEHVARLQQAEQQYLTDCKAAYEQRNMTEEDGYFQLLDKERQLLDKNNKELLNLSLEDLERQQQAERSQVLSDCYNTNSVLFGNEKVRNQRLFEINIDYLRRKAELYRQAAMSKEAHQIEQQIAQAEADEAMRKQQEYADKLQQWRKEYSGTSAKIQMSAELAVLDEMHKAGLVKEEEYQQLRKAIQQKYAMGGKFSDGGYGDMLTNMYSALDGLVNGTTDKTVSSMEKIGAVAQSTWAIAGAALEQYLAYSQACCDVEVAEIEAKYDKEIAAAGKNQKKVAQLEEQKEKDIAKVKSKYNKQAMTIEMAQAVAQTAMAAINAYASAAAVPFVGYILAPIAAAMAVAAGALQIATIKKQHQAQQKGYYGGGFTRRSLNDREEVGVVHANEFVANARATGNSELMPFFNLLDYAQRNNTEGSLTREDVISSMGTGAVVRATATSAGEAQRNSAELLNVAVSVGQTGDTLKRLNERLENGIEAFMVMDGERGFDRAYTEYNKLKNKPRR